ncbi:hypothetical protein BDW59DRAFT_148994 [Aspergillus cavernicola]|uniref:Uncharacterized protein n=1 Tax=Aspergillus cavernicola TaxID=176166 RepID=A0ABR4I666_9EURO
MIVRLCHATGTHDPALWYKAPWANEKDVQACTYGVHRSTVTSILCIYFLWLPSANSSARTDNLTKEHDPIILHSIL